MKKVMFAIILLLGMVEKASLMTNILKHGKKLGPDIGKCPTA